ncbi:hypothetical protein Tco_1128061 [Tanacetum coccineum]
MMFGQNSSSLVLHQKMFGQNSSGLVLHLDDIKNGNRIYLQKKRRVYASVRIQFFKEKESVRFSALYLQKKRNLIVPKPDLDLELGKSISLTEAEEEAVAREVHATHARIMSGPDPEPMQEDQTRINSENYMCLLLDPNPTHG